MAEIVKQEEVAKDTTQAPPSAKRKKVNHACVYCRRSHMTCDSGRPCVRCVKRNIGHLCHDEVKEGKSKSPKLEEDAKSSPVQGATAAIDDSPLEGEDMAKHSMKPPTNPAMYSQAQIAAPQETGTTPLEMAVERTSARETSPSIVNGAFQNGNESSSFVNEFASYYDAGLFGLPPDSYSQFASEHTNSEFLVLSDFLNIIGTPPNGTVPGTPNPNVQTSNSNPELSTIPESQEEKLTAEQQMNLQASTANFTHHGSLPQSNAPSTSNSRGPSRRNSVSGGSRPAVGSSINDNSTPQEKFFLTAADPQLESPEDRLKSVINAKVEAGLMKPFNYVRGYARLQKYMDQNMSADSRSRILAPLSTFRPAFRAIAKRLTDVDLILVEEAFERLLLDYDRVFTSMAVPACLWRRTGEIFRGNKEFAALLNLPAESLRDGRLAITELMAEDSAVNYWEKYGDIAFDGQQKAVLTSCLLQVPGDPKGAVVSCCFSFTIKRDRYNIPSCIVGNFIPISF